jgi:hypothetical protein
MKTIYYYPSEEGFSDNDIVMNPEESILADDRFSFPPETLISETNKEFPFFECPAWAHKAKRTFTIKSAIDIRFTFDFSKVNITGEVFINNPHLTEDNYIALTEPTFNNPNWFLKNPNRLTMQLTVPRYIFWTKDKDIWIEQRAHPEASARNNIVLVGGWFNISSWPRHLSFAYNVFDVKNPVNIKRGDPIFQVCFHSKNQDENFKLVKKAPPKDMKLKIKRNVSLKNLSPNLSSQFMFGQEEKESKCPFKFLWKD